MKMLQNVFFAIACLVTLSSISARADYYGPVYDDYDYEDGYYTPGIVGGAVSDAGRAVEDVGGIIGNII